MVQDGHVESQRTARYLVADAAQSDNAEDLVVDLLPQHEARVVGHKVRAAGEVVALDEVARRGQEEGEGYIGRRAVEDLGRVAYGDAALLGGLEVDVIDADAVVADDAEVGHEIHVFGGEGVVAVVVHAFDGAEEFGWGLRLQRIPAHDFGAFLDHGDDGVIRFDFRAD